MWLTVGIGAGLVVGSYLTFMVVDGFAAKGRQERADELHGQCASCRRWAKTEAAECADCGTELETEKARQRREVARVEVISFYWGKLIEVAVVAAGAYVALGLRRDHQVVSIVIAVATLALAASFLKGIPKEQRRYEDARAVLGSDEGGVRRGRRA